MQITAVRLTPVNIPLDIPFLWTGGLYPGTTKVIIEVETDEGLTGLGEAPSDEVMPALRSMADRIVGRDPLDIADLERRCVPPWQIVQNTDGNAVVRAFGAIEIALWDLRGKAWGQPLYQLLGGAVRKDIPFTEYFSFRAMADGTPAEMTPEAVVDYCLRMREEHGSTFFEGKLILGDPDLEIETVRRMREALGPKAMIRLDSNMQWSLATARRVLRELEPYDVRNYEDPVGTWEEMAALRQHSSIPFSSHVPDIRRAVALGVPDTIVVNFSVLGGISRAVRFIGACEAMGVGFWCYSGDAGDLHRRIPPHGRGDAAHHRAQPVAVPLAGGRRDRRRAVPADRQRHPGAGGTGPRRGAGPRGHGPLAPALPRPRADGPLPRPLERRPLPAAAPRLSGAPTDLLSRPGRRPEDELAYGPLVSMNAVWAPRARAAASPKHVAFRRPALVARARFRRFGG